MAPANIALGLCIAATVLWRFAARRAGEPFLAPFRWRTPVHLPIAAFVALSVVSAVFSTLPSRSLEELKGFLTFLIVPFAAALFRDEEDVEVTLDLWRITALVVLGRGFAEMLGGRGGLEGRLTGGLSNHMTFSGLLLPFVIVFLARALGKGRPRSGRLFDLLVAGAAMGTLVLTLTRSAWVGVAIGLIGLLVASRPRLLVFLPVVAGALLFLGPPAVTHRALSIFDRSDESARDRLAMWEAGMAMVKDHPLTGVGPGRVDEVYPEYRRPGYVMAHPGHLHNNMIMIAAETGLPSLAAYLWYVIAFFRHAAPGARENGRGTAPLVRGAVAAMAALFVAGLFEYNFGDVEILRVTLLLSVLPFVGTWQREGEAAGREPS